MPHAISDSDWPIFEQLLRDYQQGKLRPATRDEPRETKPPLRPAVVCLRDDLETGETVEAERLRFERRLQVQDVMIVGYPSIETDEAGELIGEPPTFTLRLIEPDQGDTPGPEHVTAPIPITATPAQFRQAIPEDFGRHLRSVTLGGDLMRWRIALARRPGTDIPLIEVEQDGDLGQHARVVVARNRFVGTGSTIPVHSVLPTGEPTPLKIGAQCVVLPFPFGWGVVAAECRKIGFDGEEPEAPGY
jgi:hypothetical protein